MKKIKQKTTKKTYHWQVCLALAILVAAVLGFLAFRFKPQETETGRSYNKYRNFYEEVLSYNYGHGGSEELEQRIIQAVNDGSSDSGGYFFYLLSAAEYYYYIMEYEEALSYAERAERFAPTDSEWEMVTEFYIKYYKQVGDEEKYTEYKKLYDDYITPSEDSCGGTSDAEE